MLISFSVENYSSFAKPQTLSMIPSRSNLNGDSEGRFLLDTGCVQVEKLLPLVLIYGANGAGKSALVNAIKFMKSTTFSKFTRNLRSNPHKRHDLRDVPSGFELMAAVNGTIYRYCLEILNGKVFSEYLFARKGEARRWERLVFSVKNESGSEPEIEVNRDFIQSSLVRTRAQYLPDWTLLSQLFFTPDALGSGLFEFYSFLNNLQIQNISDTKQTFNIEAFSKNANKESNENAVEKETILDRTANFLSLIDPSIVKVTQRRATDEEALQLKGIDAFEYGLDFEDKLKEAGLNNITIVHRKRADGSIFSLPILMESLGIRQLERFYTPYSFTLGSKSGGCVVADELGNALHPEALDWIIDGFTSPISNKSNSQLIFTTHAPHAMDNPRIDNDQIWFVEKDKNLETELYCLTDFSRAERTKGTSRAKSYLAGRFGAIPNPSPIGEKSE